MNRRDFCDSMTGLAALAVTPSVGISQTSQIQDAEVLRVPTVAKTRAITCEIPRVWRFILESLLGRE